MNLKFKFTLRQRGSARAIAMACALPAMSAAHGMAQITRPVGSEQRLASPHAVAQRYRDGDAWVQVSRVNTAPPRALDLPPDSNVSALQDVVCSRAGKRFVAKVGNQAVVQVAPGQPVAETLRQLGLRRLGVLSERLGLYRVASLEREDGIEIAARLASAAGLISATPDLYLAHRAASFAIPPNDPHYGAQWYLRLLGIESAWRLATGDPETKVAIVDTGCDMQHPDLAAAFVQGHDLVDGDDDPSFTPGAEGNQHGTSCSGIVAAVGNNGIGVVGICPQCKLICLRLFREQSDLVPVSADIEAFDRALTAGAAVVSNSWGFAEATPVPAPLRRMIETIMREGRGGLGSIVVFAAGNENREIDADELAAIPGVLNVAAVNNYEEAAPYSNFGESVGITAPNATYTTDISGPEGENAGDYTAKFGGTSAACPVVAGVAALVLSADPTATASAVTETLISTARPALYARPDALGHDAVYGYGMIDPAAALRRVLGLPAQASEVGVSGAAMSDTDARATTEGTGGCSYATRGWHAGPLWLSCAMLGALWLWHRRRSRT